MPNAIVAAEEPNEVEEEPSPPPPPTFDTLPPEILVMILGCSVLSLKDLYHFRRLCKSIGSAALEAFISRVRKMLVLDKDFYAFDAFLDSVRGKEEEVVEQELDDENAFIPLGPDTVGHLLRRAGIPAESSLVRHLHDRYATPREYDIYQYPALLAGMKPTLGDIRLVIINLDLCTSRCTGDIAGVDDEYITNFLEEFHLKPHQEDELILSLLPIEFVDRLLMVVKARRRQRGAESAEETRTVLWPLIVKYSLEEVNGSVNVVEKIVAYFLESHLEFVRSSLVPVHGLSFKSLARILLLCIEGFNDDDDDHFEATDLPEQYFCGDTSRAVPTDTSNQAQHQTLVSNEECAEFFDELQNDPRFAYLLSAMIESDRWPKHLDFDRPHLSCNLLDDKEFAKQVCSGLDARIESSGDSPQFVNSADKFVEANLVGHKDVWREALQNPEITHRENPVFVMMRGALESLPQL